MTEIVGIKTLALNISDIMKLMKDFDNKVKVIDEKLKELDERNKDLKKVLDEVLNN